jgi:serine/threonine-protein kinase HipA
MAMKLGSKYKFSEVELRHWEQFATAAGLSVAQTRKRILELAKQLPLTARKLQSEEGKGFAIHPIVDQIISLIEQRSAQTIKRLSGLT